MNAWVRIGTLLFLCGFFASIGMAKGGFTAWFLFGFCSFLLLCGLSASAARSPIVLRELTDGEAGLQHEGGLDRQVRIRLIRRGWLPLPWVYISETWFHANGKRAAAFGKLLFVWRQPDVQVSYRLPTLPRGVYRSGGLQWSTGDLFGIGVKRGQSSMPAEFRVPPSIHGVEWREAERFEGSGRPSRDGEPAGLREYRSGDSARRMDWRATARLDKLCVRPLESQSVRHLTVILDTEACHYDGAAGRRLFDQAAELCASYMHAARRAGWSEQLAVQAPVEHEGIAKRAYSDQLLWVDGSEAAMDWLAAAQPSGKLPFYEVVYGTAAKLLGASPLLKPALQAPLHARRLLVVTPAVDEALVRTLKQMKDRVAGLEVCMPQTLEQAASARMAGAALAHAGIRLTVYSPQHVRLLSAGEVSAYAT